jgi:hypothetical protein
MKHFFWFFGFLGVFSTGGPLYVMIVKTKLQMKTLEQLVCRFGIGDANANTRIDC